MVVQRAEPGPPAGVLEHNKLVQVVRRPEAFRLGVKRDFVPPSRFDAPLVLKTADVFAKLQQRLKECDEELPHPKEVVKELQ